MSVQLQRINAAVGILIMNIGQVFSAALASMFLTVSKHPAVRLFEWQCGIYSLRLSSKNFSSKLEDFYEIQSSTTLRWYPLTFVSIQQECFHIDWTCLCSLWSYLLFLPTDGSVASLTSASIILYHLISVMCSRCNDILRSWQMKVTNFCYTVSIMYMQLLHAICKTIEWKY